MRKREAGAGGALIAVVLAFIALLIVAFVSLNRTSSGSAEREQTTAKLAIAATALESFASAAFRLPCPANPNPADPLADGVEMRKLPDGLTCLFPEGTIPWNTIGMRREDSFDAWGRRISYRVFTGDPGAGFGGSVTQDGGASMANCDIYEASVGNTSPVMADGSGGLCLPFPNNADPSARTTRVGTFLALKRLKVTDFNVPYNDVAYVLISHGITGLGGYTASGRLDLPPNGDELDNTRATGPFVNRAFSDPDTGATAAANAHFDDLILYRRIEDLAKRANLAARNWPDTILSAVVFDRATVKGALGGTNPGSDTGRSTIAFNNATVSAFDSSGSQNISFVSGGGSTDGIGGVSGGDGLLSSAAAESLRLDFPEDARQFAFTLDKFDDSGSSHEIVQLEFFEVVGGVPASVGVPVTLSSCAANGKVTSFSVDAGANFNRVVITSCTMSDTISPPCTMLDPISPSSFSLSEIQTCAASVTCVTSLQPTGNVCP